MGFDPKPRIWLTVPFRAYRMVPRCGKCLMRMTLVDQRTGRWYCQKDDRVFVGRFDVLSMQASGEEIDGWVPQDNRACS